MFDRLAMSVCRSGFPRYVFNAGRQIVSTTAARFPQFSEKIRDLRAAYLTLATRVRETGISATARYSLRKVTHSISSHEEVLLFEASHTSTSTPSPLALVPLLREHLVEGSIINANDSPTLRYLMRCAARLQRQGTSGYRAAG